MTRGGTENKESQNLSELVAELLEIDCSITDDKLRSILSHGAAAVPYLIKILQAALDSTCSDKPVPPMNTEWFRVIHALYLLAHLESEKSLDAILSFLARKQQFLDSWLHDLVDEDLWEVIYLSGRDQVDKLEIFMLEPANNHFSKLAVATALVQIGLHFPEKQQQVCAVFDKVLTGGAKEDSEYIGLVASELMDLLEPSLKPIILQALVNNNVWPGILSADDVEINYRQNNQRLLMPLDIFQRYKYFRQHPYFSKQKTRLPQKLEKRRQQETSNFKL